MTETEDKAMKTMRMVMMVFFFVFGSGCGCVRNEEPAMMPDHGGNGGRFKIPLPTGYDWEITQSWAEHCDLCNGKGYNKTFGDYCEGSSHLFKYTKYGWDFSLSGEADNGKPALASGGGKVKVTGYSDGWGNYVVIDHENNICTRYAHLKDDSITVSNGQQVCQGLKIAEIGDTGSAVGSHLHFQFEECDTQEPLAMGFDDGNDVPVCTMGKDIRNANGKYNFLVLSNVQVDDCDEGPSSFGGAEFEGKGWRSASCGALSGCPLIPNCDRNYGHQFRDQAILDAATAHAAAYLHSECVIDGKQDGKLHPNDKTTRAEALKVALHLFGLSGRCGPVSFGDVRPSDWFYDTVSCGVKHGIINTDRANFYPNNPASMGEAAKMLVMAAKKADVIQIQRGSGNFSNVDRSHWAYSYLETLYFYGGLPESMLSRRAESEISRGEYFVMAASLSPCYCPNVSCKSGCVCDQAVFSCRDPEDNTPGTGGDESEDEDEEEEPSEEEDDPDEEEDEEPNEEEDDPDEEEEESGGRDGGRGTGSGNDSGNNDGGSGLEVIGNSDEERGGCDPSKWYTLVVSSAGGSFEVDTVDDPNLSGRRVSIPPVPEIEMHFRCADMPVAVLLHGGSQGLQVRSSDYILPVFSVWVDYSGPVTISPSGQPNFQGTLYFTSRSNLDVLFLIPTW